MKKRVLQILLIGIMLFTLLVSSLVSCIEDLEGDVTPGSSTPPAGNGTVDDDADAADDSVKSDGSDEINQTTDSAESDKISLSSPDNGGAAGLEYKKAVKIDISDKKVTLYFMNAARSTHNVTVQLVSDGKVLAESGVLTPGNKITKLTLKDGISISNGVYDTGAKLVVKYYDPQTNACAAVDSEFNITLTVVA